MNLALASVKKKVISWMVIILTVAGGIFAYQNLGRLEDPEFTIKDAKIYTNYPGATAQEVEEEVTDSIEKAVQDLGQLKEMESLSRAGFSEITVTIQDKYTKNDLPQVWDELRRKIGDVQNQLPPGAQPSIVFDDFGDVYGIYLAMTGEGYSDFDLDKFADSLRTQLLLVSGISKISIGGIQESQIFIEISRYRLAQLGISEQDIYNVVAEQNLVEPGGTIRLEDEGVRILPTGQHKAIEDISNLVVTSSSTGKQFSLKDIAQVSQGYQEVPTFITRYNGKPSLTLAISATSGTNVVELGYHIKDKLEELAPLMPPGVELHPIYMQSDVVEKSVNGFVVSLMQALGIVIAVLLVSMGLRSGLIIGGILLLSVLGTLLFMYLLAIDLERISLGALIIALGMLVDNAIVITEGILIGIQKGQKRLDAVRETVQQNQWPLLGATVIGILAFAAIGLSQDNTGEYLRSLFYVIGISLTLSWIFAIILTPMLCVYYLPAPKKDQENVDPYAGKIYQNYKGFLEFTLKHKPLTFVSLLLLLGLSLVAFRMIPQGFFPDSTTPIFYIDYWREQGTDIRALDKDMKEVEQYILSQPEVTNVTSLVGQGASRFMLVYKPEGSNPSYGQFIVEVQDSSQIPALEERIFQHLRKNNTQAELKTKRVVLGTGGGNKIEARFLGPDPNILRMLSEQAQAIMAQDPKARNIRDDWRNREAVLRPIFDEQRARQVGISKSDINRTLNLVYSGLQVGIYRQKDDLIPIIARPPEKERYDINSMRNVSVWSPTLNASIPMSQVTSDVNLEWEDGIVRRRDGLRAITASSDPAPDENTDALFQRLRPQIEAIPLPPGYTMEWGGEYESSTDAQTALVKNLPVSILLMIAITVMLFNGIRQAVVIWLCVPLALIGVSFGLLATYKPFDFMALLGFLSLIGMLLKNAIVLVEQIDTEIALGKNPYDAIVFSAVSRARPVSMAAATTVLGMIPLLPDVFFSSMAVTIMSGLTFATILTLVVVPVLYAKFLKV